MSDWTPMVTLDLETASVKALEDIIRKFRDLSAAATPPAPLALENGWYMVTPQMAEDFLRRNEANRKVSLATVRKYAYSMETGDWRKTGQGLIFNKDGKAEDLQHRCWASYLGGHTFETFIVTDVEPQADLFAYYDDIKPRSTSDALYTSGLNGLSSPLSKAAQLAWRYDHNGVGVVTQPRVVVRLNPREVLKYVRSRPLMQEMAQRVVADYHTALKLISDPAVAFFFAWRVGERFGLDFLDEFYIALGSDPERLETDSAIAGLIQRLERDQGERDHMKDGHRLALMIKAFSLHISGKKLGRKGSLSLLDNEKYPRIEDIALPAREAAQ